MPWIVERPGKKGTYYYLRVSINGKKSWRSFGRSEAKAKRALTDMEREIARGDDLPRRSDWTLKDIEAMYLDHMKRNRPRSDRWRRERFAAVKKTLGADCLLESVTLETLDRYADARLGEGRSRSTVLGEIFVIRHCLRQAFRWRNTTGLSQYRLGEWQPFPNDASEDSRALATADAEKVLAAAHGLQRGASAHVREGCLLTRLFLATGARPSELLALTVESLDPKARTLRLPGFKKGIKWRYVELSGDLAADLMAMARERGAGPREPFFPPTDALPKDRYKGVWLKIRDAAFPPDPRTGRRPANSPRFYDLRHTFSAEFLRRGGKLRDLQYRLAHKSIRTTEKNYARFERDFRPPRVLLWRGAQSGAPTGRNAAVRAGTAERKGPKNRGSRTGRPPRPRIALRRSPVRSWSAPPVSSRESATLTPLSTSPGFGKSPGSLSGAPL